MVGHARKVVMESNRSFYKMSGSGNDFVFFDLSDGPAGGLETESAVRALSARATGVGADGVVFLEPRGDATIAIRYYNSDGSRGELCGNATLCALRLSQEIGVAHSGDLSIETDAGTILGRMVDGLPEIDLAPVSEVRLDVPEIPRLGREANIGFARAGVPHIVIIDEDAETADIAGRGSRIRRDPSLRDGANVNFVTPGADAWSMRTYERGVEGETLACGTGAVATAILLMEWGRASTPVRLRTRSGRTLEVRVRKDAGLWYPSLRGAADMVFSGQLRDPLAP